MATLDEIKIELNKYYETILQRIPGEDEVNSWAAPVNAGALTLDQVRQTFINSSEAQHVAGVIRIYQAAFGRVPDQEGLKNWTNSGLSMDQIAEGFVNSEEFTNRYGSNNVTEAFVTSLYFQVLGRAPDAEGLANWTNSGLSAAQILAGFSESQEFKNSTTTAVSTFLDDAGKGTQDYSGKLIEDSSEPEPEIPSQAFTLTTSVVSTEGGEGNDSVSGLIDTTTGSLTSTLQAGDVIDLKGGVDTANITLVNNGSAVSAGWQMNNVEVINVNSVDGASGTASTATINLAGAAQTTEAWNKGGSSGAATNSDTIAFTDVAKGTLIGVQKVSNVNTSATFATIATSGTDDIVNIAVDGIASTASTDGKITIGAGFEKANINSAGAASKIGALSFGGTVKELSITADQDLAITSALDASIVKVSAGEFSGDLSIVAGAVADAGGSPDGIDLTVISGSGNDTIDVIAVPLATEFSVSTGAGDDRVVVGVKLDAADVIDGGEGTDTLSLSVANSGTFATDLSKNVNGIDVLELTTSADSTGSVHTLNVAGTKLSVTELVSAASEAGDTTNFTGVAANSTLTIKENIAAVGVTIGTNTSADTVNVVLDGVTAGTVTASNYETVNLTSRKDALVTSNSLTTGLSAALATSLKLNGDADLSAAAITLKSAASVDASEFSGKITTGFSSSLKSYLGGSSDDVITVTAGNIGTGVALDGGLGDKDVLKVTAAADQNAGLVSVKGFETVELTTAAGSNKSFTGDFRNVTDLVTLKLVAAAVTDDVTLNRLSDSTVVEITTSIGDVTLDLSTGSSHSIKSSGGSAITINKLTLDSAATELNFDAGVIAGAGTTITSLVGTSLSTMNVKGDGHLVVSGPGTLETVNASEMKGNLSVTLTATSGDLSVTGGEGNDTINVALNVSATGTNTLSGGKGFDTLTLGVGSKDTVVLNAGDAVVVDAANTDVASIEKVAGFTVLDDSFKIGNDVVTADFGSTAIVFADPDGGGVLGVQASIGAATVTDSGADFTGGVAKFMDALESLVVLGGTNALKANGVQTFAVSGLASQTDHNGTYAFIDEDGVAGYTAGVDSIIKITGLTGTLAHTDFIA